MPPRLNVLSLAKPIAFRPKPRAQWAPRRLAQIAPSQCRAYSDASDLPGQPKKSGTVNIPHVSEEAAKTAEILGEQGPEIDQGTPVSEVSHNPLYVTTLETNNEKVLKGDKEAQKTLPKVMQDALKKKPSGSAPSGSRSYSTLTSSSSGGDGLDMGLVDFARPTAPAVPGAKFELPSLPLPKGSHVKQRYDPVVDQVTNLLMLHGRKSVAQRNMALILQHLRTSPIPTINPKRPLLPGAPPPSHLPLNPILYLTLAIDSVAPLMRIRSQKGAAGGGVALQIPVPLGQRQRRRTAIQWLLSAASKRRTVGSGKGGFAQRVAQELIGAVEGRSSVWERRNAVHKLGVAARANVVLPKKR